MTFFLFANMLYIGSECEPFSSHFREYNTFTAR